MKTKKTAITPSCELCEHARIIFEGGSLPLSLLSFKTNAVVDEACISCPYKKDAAPGFRCRRFRFDPLKYRPKSTPKLTPLDEDALLLD